VKTISHSGLRLWRNCQRQYFYAYELLKRPRKKPFALAFGSAWDLALDEWHHGTTPEDKMLRGARILAEEKDEFTRAKAEAMLVGYTAQWAEQSVKIISTQVGFRVPILHPETGEAHPEFEYTGALDALAWVNGRKMVLESKTSGEDISPGSGYWQRVVALDPQVSMYLLASEQDGLDVVGCLYDVAKKPELRPKKGETAGDYRDRCAMDIASRPDHYFQRREIVRLESEARAYQQDLWDYACMLTEAERIGRFPRNPDHCRKFGRPCEYLAVCMGEADIDDPVLFGPAERGNVHERTRTNPERPAA
jgi:hypothetical protein